MRRQNMIALALATLAMAACGVDDGDLFTGGKGPNTGNTSSTTTNSTSSSSTGGGDSGTGGSMMATTSSSSSAGGSSSSSSSNSSSSGTCVPKTCLTIAVELAGTTSPTPDACGVHDDSCGNFVDCGGCNNPDQACGANAPNDHGGGATDQGTPGLCGGGCTKQNMQTSDAACGFGKPLYICTNQTLMPPSSLPGTCVTNGNPGQPSTSWCCP